MSTLFDLALRALESVYGNDHQSLVERLQPTLVASQPVPISKLSFDKIRQFIANTESIFKSSEFKSLLVTQNLSQSFEPGYESLFSSYDFHVAGDDVKLIEINTNASMSSLFHLLNQTTSMSLFPDFKNNLQKIVTQISPSQKIFIMDENPSSQPMYFEFLVFQKWFKEWGFECEIVDTDELNTLLKTEPQPCLIYNRDTDFYLERTKFSEIKKLYFENYLHLSPNPRGYFLRADKYRLQNIVEFLRTNPTFLHNPETLLSVIPKSIKVDPLQADWLWQNRSEYFFKPQNSFGSKAVYKGKSITKKVFQHILSEPYVAQQFCPAGECDQQTPQGLEKFKFDIRVYTFGSEILMMGARCYQGQVTNFRTLGGGAAPVVVEGS